MNYNEIEKELSSSFETHKRDCWQLIESYERLGFNDRAARVAACGTDLMFSSKPDGSDHKLYRANFCRDRLCWMCSWRRTLKIFGRVSRVMDHLQENYDYRYIFITLTMKNCSGDNLSSTLSHFSESLNRFFAISRIKKAFKGCFRSYEVTYRPDLPSSLRFHPHAHLIAAVNKSYFKGESYITHGELRDIWRSVCRLDYDPIVYIENMRPVVTESNEITFKKAVAEVAKYSVKPYELFVNRTDDEIDDAVFYIGSALSGRRLCSFTGVLKRVAKQLKLDDLNDGDLVLTDQDQLRSDVNRVVTVYKWCVGFGYQRLYSYLKPDFFT